MYRLYYFPGLASMAPHFVLREIGVEHELVLVDRSLGAHQTPEYLALNPNGRIPTFTAGPLVLFESAAICLHLADRHADAGLIPAVGSDGRAQVYKWLMFLTNTLQADLWQFFRPEFYVEADDREAFRKTMDGHISRHLDVIDHALEGRQFLVDETLSIADLYLFMLGRWTRLMRRPAATLPNVGRLLRSLAERRAVREALAIENIAPPYF